MSERDTHFQRSAKRLCQRLYAEIEYGPNNGNLAMQKAALEQIITRHDYDLVMHVIDALKPFIVICSPPCFYLCYTDHMEEKQTPQKQIYVTEATITFADETMFHASEKLLKELSERMSKRNTLPCPTSGEEYDIYVAWVET